jgi:GNAT superfamily N-acetyltransferase
MDSRQSRAAADANFAASFRKLVQYGPDADSRDVGGVLAFISGLPIGLFNGCLIIGKTDPRALGDAIRWVDGAALPFRVWMRDGTRPELAAVPARYGLALHPRRYPGMALHPLPTPPRPPAGVAVRRVRDRKALDEHRAILTAAGATPSVAEGLLPDALLTDPDVGLLTAYLDARPVGTALAIRSETTVGIYNVGTAPSARRRGVGTAATWAAIAEGRRWGCDLAVLQSSEMAESIYGSMGFRTVVRYLEFRRPLP